MEMTRKKYRNKTETERMKSLIDIAKSFTGEYGLLEIDKGDNKMVLRALQTEYEKMNGLILHSMVIAIGTNNLGDLIRYGRAGVYVVMLATRTAGLFMTRLVKRSIV